MAGKGNDMTSYKYMLTQKYLKECFDYNSVTGILKWKKRPSHHFKDEKTWRITNNRFNGKEAGYKANSRGKEYRRVELNGKPQQTHRIIWIILNDYCPDEIDHVNGNGLDNREINIRDASRTDNCRNNRRRKDNLSGVTGVNWDKNSNSWKAVIAVDKNKIYLGRYKNFNDGVIARKMAEYEYGFHQNHGQDRPL